MTIDRRYVLSGGSIQSVESLEVSGDGLDLSSLMSVLDSTSFVESALFPMMIDDEESFRLKIVIKNGIAHISLRSGRGANISIQRQI